MECEQSVGVQSLRSSVGACGAQRNGEAEIAAAGTAGEAVDEISKMPLEKATDVIKIRNITKATDGRDNIYICKTKEGYRSDGEGGPRLQLLANATTLNCLWRSKRVPLSRTRYEDR